MITILIGIPFVALLLVVAWGFGWLIQAAIWRVFDLYQTDTHFERGMIGVLVLLGTVGFVVIVGSASYAIGLSARKLLGF